MPTNFHHPALAAHSLQDYRSVGRRAVSLAQGRMIAVDGDTMDAECFGGVWMVTRMRQAPGGSTPPALLQ